MPLKRRNLGSCRGFAQLRRCDAQIIVTQPWSRPSESLDWGFAGCCGVRALVVPRTSQVALKHLPRFAGSHPAGRAYLDASPTLVSQNTIFFQTRDSECLVAAELPGQQPESCPRTRADEPDFSEHTSRSRPGSSQAAAPLRGGVRPNPRKVRRKTSGRRFWSMAQSDTVSRTRLARF